MVFGTSQTFTRLRRICVSTGCSVAAPLEKLSKASPQRSGKVEAIEVHHLGPRRREVLRELLLRVRARIDFREGAQLRVRAEDEVNASAGPLYGLRLAVASLVHAISAGGLPIGAHSERVAEKVVGQRLLLLGEHAVGPTGSGAEHAQAADKDRHLRPR